MPLPIRSRRWQPPGVERKPIDYDDESRRPRKAMAPNGAERSRDCRLWRKALAVPTSLSAKRDAGGVRAQPIIERCKRRIQTPRDLRRTISPELLAQD